MKKRLIKLVLIIPACFIAILIQLPYELARWVITGKEIHESLVETLMEW